MTINNIQLRSAIYNDINILNIKYTYTFKITLHYKDGSAFLMLSQKYSIFISINI